MLVLDISTVWELPGHHSFHVSSHPSWKDVKKKKKTALKFYNLVILILCDRVPNQTKADVSGRKNLRNTTKKSVATRQQRRLHFVLNEFFYKNQTSANLHNSCDFWDLIPEWGLLLLEGSVSSPGRRRRSCGAERVMGFLIRTGRRWQVRSRRLWRYWVFHKVALLSPDCVSILDSVTLSSAPI